MVQPHAILAVTSRLCGGWNGQPCPTQLFELFLADLQCNSFDDDYAMRRTRLLKVRFNGLVPSASVQRVGVPARLNLVSLLVSFHFRPFLNVPSTTLFRVFSMVPAFAVRLNRPVSLSEQGRSSV